MKDEPNLTAQMTDTATWSSSDLRRHMPAGGLEEGKKDSKHKLKVFPSRIGSF